MKILTTLKIKNIALLFFALLPLKGIAQEADEITTVILIRHVEKVKDGSKNPDLTEEGKNRAIRFRNLFQNAEIAEIYSTNYTRTLESVRPIADKMALEVKKYDPADKNFINTILANHKNKTILVCGHTNTVPDLVNQLIGKEKYSELNENEYGKIYIVNLSSTSIAKVIELSY